MNQRTPDPASFDVFLAHCSADKPVVRLLSDELEKHGVKAWLDIEQIAPGRPFQDEIQRALGKSKTIAICIGPNSLGRWQQMELRAAISHCVNKGVPVIPVILPGAEQIPKPLLFLAELNWVKFEASVTEQDAILRLVWGITDDRPDELRLKDDTQGTERRPQAVQPGKSSGVIFGLHGIWTHAEWHRPLYEVMQLQGWQVRTEKWTFGNYNLFQFLLPWSRAAKVKWFRNVYESETKNRQVNLTKRKSPSIVAHSFGTYILGNAMLKYDWLRFEKVVLCGSILPKDFPWDKLIERGQVQAVRNEFGVQDIWVQIVRWFVADTGPSGYSGFDCEHERIEQEEFLYSHSEYFSRGHMEAKWLPFLQRSESQISPASLVVARPRSVQPWLLYAIIAVVIALVVLGSYFRPGIVSGNTTGNGNQIAQPQDEARSDVPPLAAPHELPDPFSLFSDYPSSEKVSSGPADEREFVLQYRNLSNLSVDLLVLDFANYYAGVPTWREFPLPANTTQFISIGRGFPNGPGWYGFAARLKGGEIVAVGCRNFRPLNEEEWKISLIGDEDSLYADEWGER